MPSSTRRQTAHVSAATPGRLRCLAAPGIVRHSRNAPALAGGLGIDDCTAPQRRLRALIALGMFHHGPTSLWPRHVSLADITR